MQNQRYLTVFPDGSVRMTNGTRPTATIAEMLHAKNPAAFGKLVGTLLQCRLLSPASVAGQNGTQPRKKRQRLNRTATANQVRAWWQGELAGEGPAEGAQPTG